MPSWHPDGQIIAFAWTTRIRRAGVEYFRDGRGIEASPMQLTHGEGKNEQPSWAPDGSHLAFASTRHGRSQIYSMLADGTQVQQLTTAGTSRPFGGSSK